MVESDLAVAADATKRHQEYTSDDGARLRSQPWHIELEARE